MKIGIITLVSDNYGNKFQNYAVETLMREYGEVETFRVEECYRADSGNQKSILQKLNPSYVKQVLTCRMMYTYDMKNAERSLLENLFYVQKNKKTLLKAREDRHKNFQDFEKQYLHISDKLITHNDTASTWGEQYDYFVCGSDQIWNPGYATTSDLAFLSFSPKEKNIALAPSFGVSAIPESMREMYQKGINGIEGLSVREEAGKKIISELTGRDAEVLVDPTMAIDVKEWERIAKKPEIDMPKKYILCYFLGRVDKKYKEAIRKVAKQKSLKIIPLFDIEHSEYYTLDPTEVLYCIKNAEMVMTDSFHGTVFSILFHKNCKLFERNEGGISMSSRIETLLKKFELKDSYTGESICEIEKQKWDRVDEILVSEKNKTVQYIKNALEINFNTMQRRRGE